MTALSCGGPRAVTEADMGASWMTVCIVYPASAYGTRGAGVGAGEPFRPPQGDGQGNDGTGVDKLE